MPVIKWSYLVKSALYLHQSELNKLGEQGWELIAIVNDNAYFKRPQQLLVEHGI